MIAIAATAVLLSCAMSVSAQVKKEVTKDAKAVGKGAQTVGHKTEEIASKTASHITDKVYADKVGPDGQTIYINKHSKYYWIDKEGHKKSITKAEMKDK